MFIGHGLLAFAGVAGAASLVGISRERALLMGGSAGAFATLPDIDIVYGPVGFIEAALSGSNAIEGFWGHGNEIHRAVTHSLPVGAVASIAFGAFAVLLLRRTAGERRDGTTIAAGTAGFLASGLIGVAGVESGPLGAMVMGLFVAGGLGIVAIAARRGLSAREVSLVALIGLCTHPFGDLFTGTPPAFCYPFDVTLVANRLVLAADPTLDLLGAFAIELGTIWLAAAVYTSLSDRALRDAIDWRAALGVAYAGIALAIPAPTLDSSYQFVVSVLAVGVVIGVSPVALPRSMPAGQVQGSEAKRGERIGDGRSTGRSAVSKAASDRYGRAHIVGPLAEDPLAVAVTGLAAVTLALLAYTLTYVSVL